MVGVTSRGPLTLAALASAAVPGLDPSTVEGVLPQGPLDPYEVAFIQDADHRRWVIRSPRTPAASAQLEQSAALLALLARRLTMPVPAVKGWVALPEGGRAAVHSYLTGRMVVLADVAAGSRLAIGLGRALGHLHNLDLGVYDEAGVPGYDAETHRSRGLADLDRVAGSGKVPSGLLARWEATLEDRGLWSFTSAPTHGAIGEGTILASPDDGEEPDVKAFLGWELARVADPADDFAELVGALTPEALDTVFEAYAHARVERPDDGLLRRAALAHQMGLARTMVAATSAGDETGAERAVTALRALDEELSVADATAREPASSPAVVTTAASAGTEPVPQTSADPDAAEPVAEPEGSEESEESEDVTGAVEVEAPQPPTPVSSERPEGQGRSEPHLSAVPHREPAEHGPAAATAAETDAADDEGDTTPTEAGAGSPESGSESEPSMPAPTAAEDQPSDSVTVRVSPDPEPAKGNDHDTQEITPLIAGDDTDDVVDPSR